MFAALLVAIAAGSGSPAAVTQDPPIRLWINNDRQFERGDRAKVQVQTDDDGYVVVLQADPDGRVRVLWRIRESPRGRAARSRSAGVVRTAG